MSILEGTRCYEEIQFTTELEDIIYDKINKYVMNNHFSISHNIIYNRIEFLTIEYLDEKTINRVPLPCGIITVLDYQNKSVIDYLSQSVSYDRMVIYSKSYMDYEYFENNIQNCIPVMNSTEKNGYRLSMRYAKTLNLGQLRNFIIYPGFSILDNKGFQEVINNRLLKIEDIPTKGQLIENINVNLVLPIRDCYYYKGIFLDRNFRFKRCQYDHREVDIENNILVDRNSTSSGIHELCVTCRSVALCPKCSNCSNLCGVSKDWMLRTIYNLIHSKEL